MPNTEHGYYVETQTRDGLRIIMRGISRLNIQAYMIEKRKLIDKALDSYLAPDDSYPETIHQAIRYSVLNGGKRFRPLLALASCEAVGGKPDIVIPTACAIELIHAFSLVHDDLPALDDDDLRRGKPTTHKIFGEATAILTGDALLTKAFEVIASHTKGIPAETIIEVMRIIAKAAGMNGMIVGQVVDLLSEGKNISPEVLEFMHRNKTGALIKVSAQAGGILGRGTRSQIKALGIYGEKIGLAFQITDDILDITGKEEKTGKAIGSDTKKNKSTYPDIYGLQVSEELARKAIDEAMIALNEFDDKADPLRALAEFVIKRDA